MEQKVVTIVGIIGAKEAIELYKKVFNAKVNAIMYSEQNSDLVVNADLMIFDTRVMVNDARTYLKEEQIEKKDANPKECRPGKPCFSFYINVSDADKEYNNAIENGMEVAHPIEDAFWGDRFGCVKDKFGVVWGFATPLKKN